MLRIHRCLRCDHEWASRLERLPAVCPKCNSRYWNQRKWKGVRNINEYSCPLCQKANSSFLNLARHMVMKDRPDGPHQEWLQRFLGLQFAEYAFGNDKVIGIKIRTYWENNHSLPQWLLNNSEKSIREGYRNG